jgi:hypothetical protein
VIGEYLAQVLRETRRRPPYHIAEASEQATASAHDCSMAA